MSATTFYTVSVDTEEEWDWSSGYPTHSDQVANIQHLLKFQEICDRTGAAVTYFTNHAVLSNNAARRVMLELAQHPNVEIGLHIHPWNTPPLQPVDRVPVRDSFLHNLPVDLGLAKLRTVFDIFDECGLKPQSYRGGRYSTGKEIQSFLRDRGVIADCSILPFNTWTDDGAPDHRERDVFPVRQPPRHAQDAALWELPLSYGYSRRPFRFWHNVLEKYSHAPWKHLRLVGILDRTGLARRQWLNFEHPLGENMLSFLRCLRTMQLPFVCFSMHSSSLLVGGSPYSATVSEVERLLTRTRDALTLVAEWPEFQRATTSQVARHLESQHHARDRH